MAAMEIFEAPPGTGLLITLSPSEADDSSSASPLSSLLLTFVPDLPLTNIHPNAHGPASPLPVMPMPDATSASRSGSGEMPSSARAPASLSDVHLLMGGGSGATVFSGSIHHYGLGSVVMKHGGPKETAEHVALATIEEELRKRGGSSDAAEFFRTRIPSFSFIYISPWHCRDRGAELWSTLRNLNLLHKAMKGLGWWENLEGKDNLKVTAAAGGKKTERSVRVFYGGEGGDNTVPRVQVSNGFVDLHLPGAELITPPTEMTPAIVRSTPGFANLYNLSTELRTLQEERLWKFTQGQSEIGGEKPRTASSLLTSRQLCGDDGKLLNTLIEEFIQVVRNLQSLTHPEERDVIQDVKEELAALERAVSGDCTANALTAVNLSKKADMFVANQIKKNYCPQKGRFIRMRAFGRKFRDYFNDYFNDGGDAGAIEDPIEKKFSLTDEEKIPARFLGKLLQEGTPLRKVFDDDAIKENQRCALDVVTENEHSSWLGLIRRAVSVESESARKCVWNAGLSDAGCE